MTALASRQHGTGCLAGDRATGRNSARQLHVASVAATVIPSPFAAARRAPAGNRLIEATAHGDHERAKGAKRRSTLILSRLPWSHDEGHAVIGDRIIIPPADHTVLSPCTGSGMPITPASRTAGW